MEKLNLLKNNTIRRRLSREYELMSDNKNYNILINICDKNQNIEFIVYENILDQYVFKIDDNYPFRAPQIFFNKKKYIEHLILSTRLIKIYKNLTSNHCLCCTSLCCYENWSPGITLDHIIKDIKKNRNIKKMLYIKILCDSIVYKYLISDIDIFSFLY